MKKIAIIAMLLLGIQAFACPEQRKLSAYNACVNIQWNYGPYLNQYNEALITLTPIDESSPLGTSEIKIFPWMIMAQHEHGSRPVTQTKLRDHEYKVEKIYFMGGMQGIWQLRVQHLGNGKEVREEVRYDIQF